ncbi:unnamed protein product [Porites lobata]|uniref:Lipase maturation factor n=1 Tax=Porites lobata TaxID=104759 RepID=A0ABN8P847_9CNID|nr:unnamed protein product [Porites lobata]
MTAVAKCRAPQQVVRQGFLWCMAAIYLFAFTSLYVQIPGLYGHDGILPASYILHDLSICTDKSSSCGQWAAAGECKKNYGWMIENCMKSCNSCHILDTSFTSLFQKTPTLLWVTPYLGLDTPTGMEFLCILGIVLSLVYLVSQRCRDCLGFLALWFLYYSMLPVGQIFIRYQWDALLWESGFLAFLIAPWNISFTPWKLGKCFFLKIRRVRNISRHHDSIMLWLVKWLLFRLMFASGVVKLTYMDKTWWNLTALNWHYESQCIPTPVAWYFQKLPSSFHRLSVVFTYVIEIGIPFLAFSPVRILRVFAYCSEIFLQLLILLTGNYNFFNLLTIVLCVSLLDDKCILSRIQCFLCKRCVCSCCIKRCQRKCTPFLHLPMKTRFTSSSEPREGLAFCRAEAVPSFLSYFKTLSIGQVPSLEPVTSGIIDVSTTSQLMEHVLNWMSTHIENSKFAQAKEFLHNRTVYRIKLAGILLSTLTVLITMIVCTVKWFNIKLTKEGTIHCETAFSPEQLLNAVQLATQFAIWMGFLSLMVEILGALTRCLLEQCCTRSKLCQLSQGLGFSIVALLMFAVSLYSFTAVDRVVQRSLPKLFVNLYGDTAYLELTNAYGLFRSMTGVGGRPEIIIIGSNSMEGPWEEYNFLYKPGNIYQPPPFVAPHQPRLDWQLWFAALESYTENPWFLSFIHKLLLGKQEVLQLMGKVPFNRSLPPQFIRAQLYMYHYTQNTSSIWQVLLHPSTGKAWWRREFVKEYLPFVVSNSSLSELEALLEKYRVYRRNFAPEVTWGFLHPLIQDLREGHRRVAPTTLINVLLFTVVTCLVFKAWWRKTGKTFCSFALVRAQNQSEPPVKAADLPKQTDKENHVTRVAWTCGKCLDCSSLVQKFRTIHRSIRKRIALWCEVINSKFQEILQRCKTLWKNKWPSGKVYDG